MPAPSGRRRTRTPFVIGCAAACGAIIVLAAAGARRAVDAADTTPDARLAAEVIQPPTQLGSRQAAQQSPIPPGAQASHTGVGVSNPRGAAFPNILVNNPVGETFGIGNTQMEPAIAGHGDTLVCGFTDSRGLWTTGTLSGFAYSLDGGQTWTDGGSLPSPAPMLTYGDPTVATDFQGRWYYVSELDRGNGTGGPGTGGLSVVLHRGHFFGGVLLWDPAVIVAGTPTGRLDIAHMAVDPDRDRIYVAYTNVSFMHGQVEVVTLDQHGSHVLHSVVVQPHTPGVDHAGTRVAVGPNGEVYCVFQGDVTSGGDGQGPGTQKISRSLDFGASFSPPVVAAQVIESWPSAPPGANREEESVEYPSIAVDRSNGPNRGRVYITWHDAVLRDFSGALVAVSEGPEPNGSPQDAQILAPPPPSYYGWSIGGTLAWNDFADWYRFTGQAGDHLRMLINPGASSLDLRVVLRCANNDGSGDADTTLAASHRMPGFQVFFLFTLPTTGDYYVGVSRIGSPTGSYQAYLRRAAGTLPSTGIDHRDIVMVSSPNGVSNWTNKVRVHEDNGFSDQAMPEVVVDGDGGVHVSWYDRRWDPRCRALAHVALVSSFDGGATFTPAARITSGPSWWQVSADAIPNFGDQFRPTVVGERLHMVWADGRRGDPDVMFAPLSTAFDVDLPPAQRAVPGQGWDVNGSLRNTTPHDGALFTVRVMPETTALPDTIFVVGPVPSGGEAPLVFDPIVGSSFQGPVDVHFEVHCNRSAQVRNVTVVAYNDAVPVWLQDFTARSDADGVRLEWRASAGAEFEVQRGVAAAGPYETLTAAPLRADARGGWSFVDASAGVGGIWFYRLVAADAAGGRPQVFGPYRVESALPPRVVLRGAVPNPFNPSTEIRFALPRATVVTLRILDARGRRVATPLDAEPRKAGLHAVRWDGRDAAGVAQASGVYWAELTAGGERATTRLVLVR